MKSKIDYKKALKEANKMNDEYNYYNYLPDKLQEPIEGVLNGAPISVKDSLCVRGMESRAGSAILNGYTPIFNSTVAQRIIDNGGVIVGKTSQDSFGFGTFNVNVGVGFKIPKNPLDKSRVTGGSSGGACGVVAKSEYQNMGIAESTGGSLVAPAAFCGLFGLCPTYGLVSRYGLMDYASSLDKLGAVGKTIDDVKLLFDVIVGHDSKDSTSLGIKLPPAKKKVKIAIIKECFGEGVDEKICEKIKDRLAGLSNGGITSSKAIATKIKIGATCANSATLDILDIQSGIEAVSMPLTAKYSLPVYYILAMSEASTNLAMHCGMKYGQHEKLEGDFNEYFSTVRSKYFNTEDKRRILLGTFARMSGYRDAYYLKAAKIRAMIIEEYKQLFKKFDILISPTMPVLPPKFSEIKDLTALQHYMMDILTVGPNLAGLPHLNIPVGFIDKLPVGMMAIGDHFSENTLLQLGKVCSDCSSMAEYNHSKNSKTRSNKTRSNVGKPNEN